MPRSPFNLILFDLLRIIQIAPFLDNFPTFVSKLSFFLIKIQPSVVCLYVVHLLDIK